MAPLVDRFGSVVGRGELAKAGWLDVQLGRLRRHLKGSGLTLRTVRSRGCVLAQGN